MGTSAFRVRSVVWFVTGAVLAVAVTVTFMNAWRVDAAPGDDDATFVPITPCRLADTRPAPDRVGPAATIGAAGTQTFAVRGANGECTIPTDAVAVSLNVTALGASTQTFLTFWPDGDRPLAASLNPAPGQPPTPNAVTADLSAAGAFNVFNNAGSVDVVIDVNGYYTQASLKELSSRLAEVEAALARLDAVESGVAALDAAQPFTVFNDTATATSAESTFTDIIEVTVTAPVAGVVAVTSAASIFESSDFHGVECGINDQNAPPGFPHYVQWFAGGDAPGTFTADYETMTPAGTFDIAAGETVTYYLMCRNANGGSSGVTPSGIRATFTPSN